LFGGYNEVVLFIHNKGYTDDGGEYNLDSEELRDIVSYVEVAKYQKSMQKSVNQIYDCLTKIMDHLPEDIVLPPQLWSDIINAVDYAKTSGWVASQD